LKFFHSKIFHWILGLVGIGGSLYCLLRFGDWKNFRWVGNFLPLTLFCMVTLEIMARCERLKRVLRYTHQHISFWQSLWVNALGDIYGAATPSSIGGEVARLAALARFGLRGKLTVTAILMERLALLISLLGVLLLSVIFIFLYQPSLLSTKSLLYTFLFYGLIAIGLISFLAIAIKKNHLEGQWRQMAFKPDILAISMIHHMIRLSLLPVTLWGVAHQSPTIAHLVSSFVLAYGVSFVPIPSGGGSVEITFTTLFKSQLGPLLTATSLLWWRLASHYFYVLVSLFVTLIGLLTLSKSPKTPLRKDSETPI